MNEGEDEAGLEDNVLMLFIISIVIFLIVKYA